MKKALTVLAAAGMTVAMVSGTSAADIPMMPTVAAPPPAPVVAPAPAFSFAGPYFGAHGGLTFPYQIWNFGMHGGYNFEIGPLVAGVEVRTGLIFYGEPGGYSDLNLHLGTVLGDRTLLYGIAGLGISWYDGTYMNLGVGAEFLVTPDIGLFGQVLYSSEPFDLDEPLGIVVQFGINLH